jgi:hypothetical protein
VRIFIFLLMFTSFYTTSSPLETIDNSELSFVLNNITSSEKPRFFPKQGFEVRIYKTSTGAHCAIEFSCRSLKQLYVATTEGEFDEGSISSLYKLPEANEWSIMNWELQSNGTQGLYLESTIYSANDQVKKQKYILKISYISAELITL